jgi:formate hydrogenlyase subunit 4
VSTSAVTLLIAVQVLAAVALTPLLVGVMRQTRARMEGRAGAGVGQPWRDVRKLMAKEPLRAAGTGPLMVAAPLVLMVSSLMVCALVPLVGTPTLPLVPDDLFVVVSLLLVGTAALALLGLESGTAFGGMGSSRHMTIAALVEPTVLVAVYALSIPVGTSALSTIVAARAVDDGRVPVDNPSTHLELTMVHEAMVLESSGRDLAWLELGSWLRLTALLGLVVNLVIPWGVATTATLPAVMVGLAAIVVKLLLAGALVAAVEVFLAKLRLFRVPELLAGSFVLAFLSVTASSLVG